MQFCFPLAGVGDGGRSAVGALATTDGRSHGSAGAGAGDAESGESSRSKCELVIAASTLDRLVELRGAGDVAGLLVQLAVDSME